ncbi:WG repeat-containing protein [Leptospira levettii]|uniref:WG repeat-containing protein n=1 Tax=Leptospira levettii TaxID=2023178 RepID=UPI001083727F|nr:WG repeat-containing protein [Leptospira levettii]TGM36382.1 WG repeat-containing protein [Leptospira levettii]
MKDIYLFLCFSSLTAILSCSSLPVKPNPIYKGCNLSFRLIELYSGSQKNNYLYAPDPKIKVNHSRYEDLSDVSEEWIRAKQNGKYGFINTEDKLVFAYDLEFVGDYSNGFAVYRDGASFRDPKAYLDKKGNLLGNLSFDEAYSFYNGYALVQNDDNYGIIDTKGKFILPTKYDFLTNFHNGWAVFKREEHQGLVNTNGIEKKFVHDLYEIKSYFYEGHLTFTHYKKMGLMDSNFKILIPPKYDYLGQVKEGLIRFQLNHKWGFLDETGKIVIEPKFDDVYDFSEGYATIKIKEKYGKINKRGDYFIEPNFDYIGSFKNGIAIAEENKKRGFITLEAEWLVPPIFESVSEIKDGIFSYKLNNLWGFVNLRGCIHK